jgi:Tfp pilus assembly protein FimT
MKTKCQNQSGFTLIELIMIILVIAILGGFMSVGLSGLATSRLDQAVRKVVGDLRYAQQLAISTQSRHGMTVNSTAQYTIHRDPADTAITNAVSVGGPFVVAFDSYQQGQLSGVRLASATPFCGGANGIIEFNSIGAPTNTGGTVLTCNSSLTLNYSGNTRTITIQQNTGNLAY